MTEPTILFEINQQTGVAVLTLNRPKRLNAFNKEMIHAWLQALHQVETDPAIRALVVTGAGNAFCSGGDADELESFLVMGSLERKNYLWQMVHKVALLLERIDCPVIAAINGTARGAGLDMALMCDLRVMDATAVVAQSYIDMGLMPGDGGAWFMPRLVGPAVALEMMWTGAPVDAETALRVGMVNRISAQGQSCADAVVLAEKIAGQPSEAIRFTKRSVYQSLEGTSLRAHLDAASSHMAVLQELPAFKQKIQAFKQRMRIKKK